MEEFRAHEEKMKAYQQAKKNQQNNAGGAGRPPLGKESSLQVNNQISNGLNTQPSKK